MKKIKDIASYLYLQNRRYVLGKISKGQYSGFCMGKRSTLDKETGNAFLKHALEADQPFMAARFGASEMRVVSNYIEKELGLRRKYNVAVINQLAQWSGFFPLQDDMLDRFSALMIQSSELLDLLGVWNVNAEEYMILRYAYHAELVDLPTLEPWYSPEEPWSAALAEKKVVVIHPFAESIRAQFDRREHLFPGTSILPECELRVVQAVQTIAGQPDDRFKTWFEALDYMTEQALAEDFDVAIIGCGAYGFPLAARMKMAGKKAVHLGGATQLMFGIKGKRWDDMEAIARYYNPYWIRPSAQERPDKAAKVENGCYW